MGTLFNSNNISSPASSIWTFSPYKEKKKGFTLAEVLITLGIIGIVAALTIPSIINKIRDKEFKTGYKKAYSTINQAFLMAKNNGELLDMTAISKDFSPNIGENFKTISKYLKTTKTCFKNNVDKCWVCELGQSGKVNSVPPDYLGCDKDSYAFVDASGVAWYMYSPHEWPILVDVNGDKKPNQLGKDRFVMKFATRDNEVYYTSNADSITPWVDFVNNVSGSRWCPSGSCLYRNSLLK